ncbi:MAG: PAS domain-containing protein, partial [Phycisphaerales bacterium]|nr:PAS domain-containing protein [Phycisphaerales bacterium]
MKRITRPSAAGRGGDMTESLPFSPPASNASVSSVAVLDPDGTIVSVNGMWAEIAARAGARSAVGSNYLSICNGVSGADRPDAEAMSSAIGAVSSGACECRTLEYSCVVPGLGRHTFSARVVAIGTGSPRRVVVIHDDVTEARLVAERELVQSRMLESLLGAIEDFGIFTLDTAGRVKSWNSGARALLGYERDEVMDRHFEAFFEPGDRADGLPGRELEEALKAPVRVERPHVRKDGTRFVAFSTI